MANSKPYLGPERRSDWDDLLAKCISCEKKCSSHDSRGDTMLDLKHRMEKLSDILIPKVLTKINFLSGVSTIVGILFVVLILMYNNSSADVDKVKIKQEAAEKITLTNQNDMKHLKSNLQDIKKAQSKMEDKIDEILRRLK